MSEVDSTCTFKRTSKVEWSNLPHDMLSQIANSLGPIDFLSFRRVCKDWFTATSITLLEDKFSKCDPYFLLYDGKAGSMCSLLTDNNEVYSINIPELDGATCLASYEGWLLVFHEGGSLFFFCPFSRTKIELPNCPFTKVTEHHIAAFSSAPTCQDCIVVVINRNSDYDKLQMHLLCRGDNIWAKHNVSTKKFVFRGDAKRIALFIEGEFIFKDKNERIITFDAANTKQWNRYNNCGKLGLSHMSLKKGNYISTVKSKLGLDKYVSISTCGTLYPDASTSAKRRHIIIMSEDIEEPTVFEKTRKQKRALGFGSRPLKGVWLLPRFH